MIFPVPGGSFSPGWGAPRVGHKHKGVDIFAKRGTPIYAPSDGKINIGSRGKSGNFVRFYDAQGNRYFMGHLDKFAGGARNVRAGEIIGYVGNTGNAKGTPPHVHFQYHPGGGKAVDPFQLLKAWQKGGQVAQPVAKGQKTQGRLIGTFSATSYYGAEPGGGGFKTATGTKVGHGTVAVDPRVIPLGTKLYVEGYGYATAADTGGAIKGNRIDVWKPSIAEANKWGRKPVKVWIVDDGEQQQRPGIMDAYYKNQATIWQRKPLPSEAYKQYAPKLPFEPEFRQETV